MKPETVALGVFAAGQVVAGALSLTGVALVAAEAVAIAPLAAALDARALPPFAVSFGVLLAVLGAARSEHSIAVAAAATVAAAGLLVYGLHRYELVALGLVDGR